MFKSSDVLIYKITEIATNKCYIGKTNGNPFHRWTSHLNSTVSPFASYFRSTPISNWRFEVLEIIPYPCSLHKSFAKENEYMIKFDSLNNGFNSRFSPNSDSNIINNREEVSKEIKLLFSEIKEKSGLDWNTFLMSLVKKENALIEAQSDKFKDITKMLFELKEYNLNTYHGLNNIAPSQRVFNNKSLQGFCSFQKAFSRELISEFFKTTTYQFYLNEYISLSDFHNKLKHAK